MAQNPFATSFSIYAGSIRQRTQMAYQRAMQEMQQKQATDLAQRQFLLDRLKLENDQIKNLRSRMSTLKKSIRGSEASDSDKRRLSQTIANIAKIHSDILFSAEDKDVKKINKLTKQYVLQPDTRAAIDQYVSATQSRTPLMDTDIAIKNALGITPESANARELNNINKVLSKLETNEEQKIAFDYLLKEKYKSFGDQTVINGKTGEAAIDEIALQLASKLGVVKAKDRLSKNEAQEILKQKIDEQTGLTKDQIINLTNLQSNLNDLNNDLQNIKKSAPALTNITDDIQTANDELSKAFERQATLRTQLDKPADTQDIDISTRAGQILLEEDAMAKIGNAIQNMDDSELEALQLMNKATSIKEIDKRSKEFIDAYARGAEPQDNNIISFFKYVDKEDMPVEQREKFKTAALARLIQAQSKNPKAKIDKKLEELALEREAKFEQDVINLENIYGNFESQTPQEDIKEKKPKKKYKTGPAKIDQIEKVLQQDPTYSYGYIRVGTLRDDEGKPIKDDKGLSMPMFRYIPKGNVAEFKRRHKLGLPRLDLTTKMPKVKGQKLQPYDEALDLWKKSQSKGK